MEEESEDQQHKTSPENTPKPSPIYVIGVKNILPLTQLLRRNSNMKLKPSKTIRSKFSLKLLNAKEQL
jgi:hypothetical protein